MEKYFDRLEKEPLIAERWKKLKSWKVMELKLSVVNTISNNDRRYIKT